MRKKKKKSFYLLIFDKRLGSNKGSFFLFAQISVHIMRGNTLDYTENKLKKEIKNMTYITTREGWIVTVEEFLQLQQEQAQG